MSNNKLPFLTTIYTWINQINICEKQTERCTHISKARNGCCCCFFVVPFVCVHFSSLLLFLLLRCALFLLLRPFDLVLCWPQSIAIHAVSFNCGRQSFCCCKCFDKKRSNYNENRIGKTNSSTKRQTIECNWIRKRQNQINKKKQQQSILHRTTTICFNCNQSHLFICDCIDVICLFFKRIYKIDK